MTRRNCKKIQKNLIAYLDGELPDKKSQFVKTHLDFCPACRQEAQDVGEAVSLLLQWRDIVPTEDYDRVFWQKIKADENKQRGETGLLSLVYGFFTQNLNIVTTGALALLLILITFFQSKPSYNAGRSNLDMIMNFDLFLNMEVINNKEMLEHFEVIEVVDQLIQDNTR